MKSFWHLLYTCSIVAAPFSLILPAILSAQTAQHAGSTGAPSGMQSSQASPEIPNEATFGSGALVDNGRDQVTGRHQTQRPKRSQFPTPVITRQTRFGIPFNITEGALVREVHLYASSNQGKSWRLYNRQLAGAKEFPFETKQDGEFWFAIKTVDANGSASPQGDPSPEMIVLVDTSNPQLNFNLHPDSSGQLDCWWLATDQSLDADSLEINYRPHSPFRANLARWKKAKLTFTSRTDDPGKVEARASFRPETESLTLDVQAKITDRAGNVSVVDRRILLSRNNQSAQQQTEKERPPSVDPYGARQDRVSRSIRWQDEHQRKTATNQIGWTSSASRKDETIARGNVQTDSTIAGVDPRLPQNQSTPEIPPRRENRDESQYQQEIQRVVQMPSRNLEQISEREHPRRSAATNAGVNSSSNDPFSLASDQDRHRQATTGPEKSRQSAEIFEDNIRLSDSRKFQLDYELDLVGPNGVAKVDIWITEDHGRNWYVWGQDEDKQSPVIVTVNTDGLFGFRIGVTSKDGLSARPPGSGDQADVWIGVDTTKPTAEIGSVTYGQGADAGKLIIQYSVGDRQLVHQPVSLLYATHPDGPWTSVANRIPNDGIYKWRISERLPREVYLRLEAQDTANNRTVYILDKPINLTGLIPRGRIRNVQPIN